MYKNVIENYIQKLTKSDIIKFIQKNEYRISEKEIDVIYFYIKKHYLDFLNQNPEIWQKLKKDVSEKTYFEIVLLFQKYKKYI